MRSPRPIPWRRFAEFADEIEDVFTALNSLRPGSATGYGTRMMAIGAPPVLEYGWSRGGHPIVRVLPNSEHIDEDHVVEHCRRALAGPSRWATFAMAGRFRTAGSLAIDELQIRQIDDLLDSGIGSLPSPELAAPLNSSLNAVLVDVEFVGAADPFVDAGRRRRAVQRSSNLLTLATWPPLVDPADSRDAWTLVWDDKAMVHRNARCVRGFHHPDIGDSHSAPPVDPNSLPTVDHARLAAGPLDLLDGQLYAADSLRELWTSVNDRNEPSRAKVNRALAWYASGVQASDPAIKVPCFVSAIESAMPAVADERCTACSQPKFQLTARVNEFLDLYCSNELRREFRKSVYPIRSRIAHGMHRYDVDHALFSALDASQMDVLKVQAATHATLLNWILSAGPPSRNR